MKPLAPNTNEVWWKKRNEPNRGHAFSPHCAHCDAVRQARKQRKQKPSR